MSVFRLVCPKCGIDLEADDADIGAMVSCAECDQHFSLWLPEKSLPYYSDMLAKFKPGLLARAGLPLSFQSSRFTQEQLDLCLSKKDSKRIFHFGYPLLRPVAESTDFAGYQRYWNTPININGNEYYLCKEWFDYNRKPLLAWLRQMNVDYEDLQGACKASTLKRSQSESVNSLLTDVPEVNSYIKRIISLKTNKGNKFKQGISLHKPTLCLTIVYAIEKCLASGNLFPKRSFSLIFNRIWDRLVDSKKQGHIWVPFLRLANDGFWTLNKNGEGSLEPDIFDFLSEHENRLNATNAILKTFFRSQNCDAISLWRYLSEQFSPEWDVSTKNIVSDSVCVAELKKAFQTQPSDNINANNSNLDFIVDLKNTKSFTFFNPTYELPHTKPIALVVEGNEYQVRAWNNIICIIVSYIYEKSPEKILALAGKDYSACTKRICLQKNNLNLVRGKKIADALWVEINFSSKDCLRIACELAHICDLNSEKIVVYYTPAGKHEIPIFPDEDEGIHEIVLDNPMIKVSPKSFVKRLDWSTFTMGITVPVKSHGAFSENLSSPFEPGSSIDVLIHVKGKDFHASIVNIEFADQNRSPVIQIIWGRKSSIALMLQATFPREFSQLVDDHSNRNGINDTLTISCGAAPNEFTIEFCAPIMDSQKTTEERPEHQLTKNTPPELAPDARVFSERTPLSLSNIIDLEEGKAGIRAILEAHFQMLYGYSNITILWNAAQDTLSLFLNDNAINTTDELWRFMYSAFFDEYVMSNPHIWQKQPNYPKSYVGVIINLARQLGGTVARKQIDEYFKHIQQGVPMNATITRQGLLTFYTPKHFILTEAVNLTTERCAAITKCLDSLFEHEKVSYIVLRDITPEWFSSLPTIKGGLRWTALLLQEVLRLRPTIGYRVVFSGLDGQALDTLGAAVVSGKSDISSFADVVHHHCYEREILGKRIVSEDLRTILRDAGMLEGNELIYNLHKALRDHRFAFTDENRMVKILEK